MINIPFKLDTCKRIRISISQINYYSNFSYTLNTHIYSSFFDSPIKEAKLMNYNIEKRKYVLLGFTNNKINWEWF